jgi:hypothetical protein
MNLLHIRIDPKTEKGWPAIFDLAAAGSSYAVRRKVWLQFDPETLNHHRIDPRGYGTVLGQALFHDRQARELFVSARARTDGPLHVLLSVEAEDLRSRFWGRLCAPLDAPGADGWDFVALKAGTPFALYLPAAIDQRFPPIGRRQLRALVLVASPADPEKRWGVPPFDVATAVTTAVQAIHPIDCDILARGIEGAKGLPTLEALAARLVSEHYPLLHLVCHGRQRSGGEPTLYLEDAAGGVAPVGAQELLTQLNRLHGSGRGLPRFVFLSSCQTAAPEAGEGLAGLAQRLVCELGVPAVLAMSENVSVRLATELVRTFYPLLLQHSHVDRALAETCAALAATKQYDVHVPVLYSRLGGEPLFREGSGPPTAEDIRRALEGGERLFADRAPVLRPRWQELARTIRAHLAEDPDGRPAEARREWEKGLQKARNEIDQLCEEVLDLRFDALAHDAAPKAYNKDCPFLGMLPFTLEQALFFFGRRSLIRRLVRRLREREKGRNFLAVLGASGSGKSSLVLAGLLPALKVKPGEFAYVRPGGNPVEALADALSPRESPPRVLVVDQFEELFTLCKEPDRRQAFVDALLARCKHGRVVVAMRADFWGECAEHPRLHRLMQRRQELIRRMTRNELAEAVAEQAWKVGLRFEADLLAQILDDVSGEPGAMPLLQHALRNLWERRHGWRLPAREYRESGGVKQAIEKTANDLYNRLPDEERRSLMKNVFLRLTRLDEGATGDEWRDTRQTVTLDELVPAGGDLATVRDLVAVLADARLVVTAPAAGTAKVKVEVAHEALIQHWPQLREWVAEDRASHILHQGVRTAAREWANDHRNRDLLIHHGKRLEGIQILASNNRITLNALETEYLAACHLRRDGEPRLVDVGNWQNLNEAGWGVIFPQDADPRIKQALQKLLDHRRAQAAEHHWDYYREFTGPAGYRPGETKTQFLSRHGVGTGRPAPERMPHYLLLVGDPQAIPYEFQYALDVQYAVGRIHFPDLAAYEHYAESLVRAERQPVARPRTAVLFGPRNPGDPATQMSADRLLRPLADYLRAQCLPWMIRHFHGEDATKEQLRRLLGGEETPALLVTAGHGMWFPSGDQRQLAHIGALLCQDWPGFGVCRPEFYFSADDLGDEANLLGSVMFFWSCFSAGAPRLSDYDAYLTPGEAPQEICPTALVSPLPQRLLGHLRGGALAVIGRVERAWAFSFMEEGAITNLGTFEQCVLRLLEGHPVGMAVDAFSRRYSELSTELNAMFDPDPGKQNDVQRKWLLTAVRDARNYVIVGDPAVRLTFP